MLPAGLDAVAAVAAVTGHVVCITVGHNFPRIGWILMLDKRELRWHLKMYINVYGVVMISGIHTTRRESRTRDENIAHTLRFEV